MAFRARSRFALEPGGAERIDVSWETGLRRARVKFDDEIVAAFDTAKDFERGDVVVLPGGGRLEVRWGLDSTLRKALLVRLDGKPAPQGLAFYERRLKNASWVGMANGIWCALFGYALWSHESSPVAGPLLVVAGVVVTIFGWLIRRGMRMAVLIVCAFGALDTYFALDASANPGRFVMLFAWRILWAYWMFVAYEAIGIIARRRARAPANEPA